MTITSAINSAMSGLTANARSSQVVSENLANALTPGYSAQRLNLSTNSYTGGTKVDGVERLIDPALQASARTAEAEHSAAETYANFYSRMSSLVGVVDDDTSISAQISNFDSALVEAVSRPDSTERLHQLSVQADLVVKTITHAADGLNALRVEAETSINSQVRTLNNSLKEIEKLNARIVVSEAAGTSTTAMQDQRDKLIDEVNKIIPVNVLSRSQGRVALYSEGGVALIDGRASEITFDALQTIEPHMTLDNGLLNGLEVNGKLIDTSADGPCGVAPWPLSLIFATTRRLRPRRIWMRLLKIWLSAFKTLPWMPRWVQQMQVSLRMRAGSLTIPFQQIPWAYPQGWN